ncbi:hypothetical protein [Pseudoalteromonas sp. H105]|uniref:hypothetical protein n=1 Tax=Pseudoalteromonas sp. H105 TaxID=1348393 RepID=UPI000731FDDE|nr:hypothetical protein [Pseudoalteromonas sp. H105]KTF12215.1 hypothetical protein ATS75_18415 [Pseudoalteromonas sp. H105]
MADFRKVLLNKDKLIEVFESLSVTDAMTVKANLEAATPHLKGMSEELLAMLKKENIDISALSGDSKPRKKRQVIAENQKFCKIDGKLKLLITRGITKAEKDGHTILSFEDLKTDSDKKEGKRLVDEYNA